MQEAEGPATYVICSTILQPRQHGEMRLPLLSLLLVLFASQGFANITITTTSLPNGTVNTSYSAVIQTKNGCGPYSWAIVSGSLPPGITMMPSSNTMSLDLYGTPTTAATYSFTILATGCQRHVSSVSYKVVVQSSSSSSSAVNITTPIVPNGTVNTAYSAAIQASGGCTPYSWSIASGSLPVGITAQPSTTTTSLNFSGTPTAAASSSFTVSATGCGGHVARASYQIAIQSAANHLVDLRWNASTSIDVTGYNVYRSPDGTTWKKMNVSLVAPTLYSDSSVASSTTYYYSVTTVDIYGHESAGSPSIQVAIP